MIEYVVVDHPAFFPQMCGCGNQKGPLIDTHRELGGRHEYVCSRCVQEFARLMGFATADVLETAAKAKQIETHLSNENAGLLSQLKEEREENEILGRELHERDSEIGRLKGRVSQLEDRIQLVAEELVS